MLCKKNERYPVVNTIMTMKLKLSFTLFCGLCIIATAQTVTKGSGLTTSRDGTSTVQTSKNRFSNDCIPIEQNGVVAVEAETFFRQTNTSLREWFVIGDGGAKSSTDPDDHLASEASGQKYIEVLPDTRVYGKNDDKPEDPLVRGENFSEIPGQLAVVEYKVNFTNTGKYFVWVRANSSGKEDNGIHVGIDNTWPDSGKRMQWCSAKNRWQWESSKRLREKSCDNPMLIYLDVLTPGEHIIKFSMREDGFEMDKFILSKEYVKPVGAGIDVFTGDCP